MVLISTLAASSASAYGFGIPRIDITTGVFGGGQAYTNIMSYITIATPSNAIDFGDLTVAVSYTHLTLPTTSRV